MSTVNSDLIKKFNNYDLALCLIFNRWVRRRDVQYFFSIVSRLGDGIFWYSLMALLVMSQGVEGLIATLHMAMVGVTGLVLYKLLKHRFSRERPFVTHQAIRLGTDPLDRHSFPSGHTLHAIGFSIIAVFYFPALEWLVIPFASLVALSRIVLGLHYPSDVMMGATIGAAIALGSLYLPLWFFS